MGFKAWLRKWAARVLNDDALAAPEIFEERHKFIEEQQALSIPWAMFEIVGFDSDNMMKIEFNWNEAFIQKLDELGFTAETPEDTVQLFFYTAQMRPQAWDAEGGDVPAQNEDLPALSQNVNRIVR
jgi:hypothetical protein